MSREISRKILRPSKVINMIRKRCKSDKSTPVDRPYSTAIAVMPEMYDEPPYERKHKKESVDSIPKEYSEVPGPKEWPIIGNAWRFAPIIGQYKIQELDKAMWSLRKEYGNIVKVGGLVGHPDLLFVFDGDLIQKVFRREEGMPHRPSMPSLHYYKQVLQKDFFEGNEGVIGVFYKSYNFVNIMAWLLNTGISKHPRLFGPGHLPKNPLNSNTTLSVPENHGPKWDAFRKQVQQILLPPATAKKYIEPLNVIATDFLIRMENMLDEKNELPNYFLSEIYKWALECNWWDSTIGGITSERRTPLRRIDAATQFEDQPLKHYKPVNRINTVARVSLNTRLGCLEPNLPKHSESQRIIDSINTFFWNVAEVELKMPVWRIYKNKSFRKYIGALEDFRTLCLKYINQSMEQMKAKNYDNVKEEDISIVERILRKTDNPKLAAVLALDLLLVGVDTTSIAVASTIYQLSQNVDKQQKLFEELKKVLPDPHTKVDAVAQNSMPYLKACIKETLRMYPVIIGNGRSLQSDTVLAGYKIPKGGVSLGNVHTLTVIAGHRADFQISHEIQSGNTVQPQVRSAAFLKETPGCILRSSNGVTHVIFPHLVVSNTEDYISEPEKFIPERWLKQTEHHGCPVDQKRIHPFISLPFGYGRRSCLGRRIAETELNILLAKIFRKYKVNYNYGSFSYKITPTYVPEQPLKFQLILRE